MIYLMGSSIFWGYYRWWKRHRFEERKDIDCGLNKIINTDVRPKQRLKPNIDLWLIYIRISITIIVWRVVLIKDSKQIKIPAK